MVRWGVLILRAIELAVPDDATCGGLARTVEQALAGEDVPRRVWISERSTRAKSMYEKILAAAPALAPTAQGRPVTMLSSFDEKVGAGVPACAPDGAAITAVADGVPERWPVDYAIFFWGPSPRLLLTSDPAAPVRTTGGGYTGVRGPEIMLFSAGGTKKRVLRLDVGVVTDAPPPDAAKVPPLPAPTRQLLDAIAEIGKQTQQVIGNPDETAATKATSARLEPIFEALRRRLIDEMKGLIFPHHLDHDRVNSGAFGPFKDMVRERLEPLGYTYRPKAGRRGIWVFAKRTARRNELVVELDRGPMTGRLFATLGLHGPMWQNGMRIPLAPGVDEINVRTEDTARRLADNLAFALPRVEDALVATVEPERPPGAAWYSRIAS